MFWNLTEEELLEAQRGEPNATRRLFDQAMATCARIATALIGTHAQADRATRELAKRALAQLPGWRTPDEGARWFMHHTILLVRQYRKPIDPQYDVLLQDVGGPDVAEYRAMIAALRKLPEQQQEAFLLTHAQKWNVRNCAVAMDCSNTAVETHLTGATRELQPLLGTNFQALTGFLRQVYSAIPIDTRPLADTTAGRAARRRSMGLVGRVLGWTVIVLLIAIIVIVAVLVLPRIET